jgi:diguanylate cyclase (GGDEF)-like protein/PAS domain S-box-containing protein
VRAIVKRQLRVLMVEDSITDATLIEWELKNAGYQADVRRVQTESELRAALVEGLWDIVTCDYGLPQFSAPAALDMVKNHGADLPFMVISGTIGEEAAVEMMRAGANDYLIKGNLARLGPALDRELRDVADRAQRRQVQQALLSSEERYRRIVETTREGIWCTDPDGVTTFVNVRMAQLLGCTTGELLGRSMFDFLDAVAREQLISERSEESVLYELPFRRMDGTELWTLCSRRVMEDVGEPSGWLVMVTDITERKQAEATLERLRRRNELILASAGEGIFGVELDGKTAFANPAAARLTGYTVDELVGQPLHGLLHHSRPDGTPYPADDCEMLAAITKGTAHTADVEVFWRKDGTSFPVEFVTTPLHDGDLLVGAVLTFKDIAERRQAEASLHYQAFHDALTGLPNRTWLRAELERMLAPGTDSCVPFALLLMDLDRFKEVNDTLGHQSGDLLLQQVGPRLRAELHETDLLARLGGDEYAVLLPGADAERACVVAGHLLRALERPFEIECSEVEVGGSIGVALYPEHGDDADTLLRRADIAMYAAKEARSGLAMYEPEADLHSPERLRLLTDLRRAIEHGELILHYQPQVDVGTGTLAAVEALVRWQHPQRGLVAPDVFIPLAEQTRLIRPLSRWVLGAALRQYAEWHAAGLSIPIALNLSAHDLHDPTLPDLVTELRHKWEVPDGALRLEITESSLMADPARAREVLARLRAAGVQIAIDDFGTGYSSLAYLKDLTVDELKIDRSFVHDMSAEAGARAIVRSIIDLSDDLGLRVVAEGVEDQATWEALAALGCDVAQGYYFAPPLEAADVAGWAAGLLSWRHEEDRARLDAALSDRAEERGTRLAAEEAFLERKRAESVVREGQERLKLALDAAGMATWEWDMVNETFAWAGTADALLGAQPGTLARSPREFLDRVHDDDRPAMDIALHEALTQGRDLHVEHRVTRTDGIVRWFACSARVFRDPSGRPVRLLGTEMDITERKEAEQQRQMLAQAEKLRALGQMASGIAHDLNQSLGLIAGFGDIAQRALMSAPMDTEALNEALPIISQAAMDGGQTVRQLLTFARTQPDGAAERVDLGALLREVAQLTAPRWRDAPQAAGRPISLHVQTAGELIVEGWPISMREALTNLIFNAVDALPAGGIIRLAARRVDENVVVEVSDSGLGMSTEVQERIFEPFFTTKGERGTGLGLAQVFGVMEQHYGTVAVDSSPGMGTTFRLTLPAVSTTSVLQDTAAAPSTEVPRLRVLAVDDEPAMGNMIRRVLRPRGHSVVTATSGEEALERLADESFDVLISDVGMGPGMNGWELVERLRQSWPEMHVVLATGWGAAIDSSEARAKGVDAVIAKPYRPGDLEELLDKLTRQPRRQEAA